MKQAPVSTHSEIEVLSGKYHKKKWDATNYIYWSITSILIGLFIIEFFVFKSLWKTTLIFKSVLIGISFIAHYVVSKKVKSPHILVLSYLMLFAAYCFSIIAIEQGLVVTLYFTLLTLVVCGANYLVLWDSFYAALEVFLITSIFILISLNQDLSLILEKMSLGGYAFFAFMLISAFVPDARKRNYMLNLEREQKKQDIINNLAKELSINQLLIEENKVTQKIDKDKEKLLRHDLKNKIHNIIGLSQIIDGDELNDEDKSHLQLLKDVSTDLLKYADNIYNKNENQLDSPLKIMIQPVNVYSVLTKTVKGVKNKVEAKAIDIVTPELQKDSFIKADFLVLNNVLENIFNYLIRWSETGSKIILTSQIEEKFTLIEIHAQSASISAHNLNLIFKPLEKFEFNSSFEAPQGLGLQIAKNMTEKMNGYFKYFTQLDGGVIFKLEFETINQTIQEK